MFKPKHHGLALAVLAVIGTAAQAQQSESKTLERVEVTGSNIKQIAKTTASPLVVFTREDIKATGASTVRGVLDTLTERGAAISDNGNGNSFAAGATGAALRNLGTSGTLVLVNGRRIANFAMANGGKEQFANVDSIPADVVERMEVLKDGASAIYGSDAMAGVVNIITRKTYEGVGLSGSISTWEKPRISQVKTAAIVAGLGNMETDRYNVLANLELYERDGYMASELMPHYPAWHKKYVDGTFGDASTISYPGNLIVLPNTRVATPMCDASQLNAAKACTSKYFDQTQWSDPAKRLNLFTQARYAFSNDLEAFAEVSLSQVKTSYTGLPAALSAPTTPYRWFDGGTLTLQEVNKPRLSITNPANNTGKVVGLEYRFMDAFDLFKNQAADADQSRVMVGLRGVFKDWDWEATLGQTEADGFKDFMGSHRTGMIDAVNSGEYKIGGTNSPELLKKMFQPIRIAGENKQKFVDAKVSGELTSLPAGPLMVAAGVDLRDEYVKIKSSENTIKAQMLSFGSLWIEGSRKLGAAYAEAEVPVFKNLNFNTAVRYDKASGFDGHFSPKVSARWQATDKLMVRGTLASGFRAPSIPETQGKIGLTAFYNGTTDPARCDTARKLQTILNKGNANDKQDAQAAFNSGCSVSVPAMFTVNPDLKPETSTSKNFGVVFRPSADVFLSVDYFQVERKDEIASPSPTLVMGKEGDPKYDAMLKRQASSEQDKIWLDRAMVLDPAGAAGLAFSKNQLITFLLKYDNLGKTYTSGIDVDANLRFHMKEGATLGIDLAWTHNLEQKYWDVAAGKYRPNFVGLSGGTGVPRNRVTLRTNWDQGNWRTGLQIRAASATSLQQSEFDGGTWGQAACEKAMAAKGMTPGELPCSLETSLATDLSVSYKGFKNMNLGLFVGNVFRNENPVNLRSGFSYAPRTFKLSAQYKF